MSRTTDIDGFESGGIVRFSAAGRDRRTPLIVSALVLVLIFGASALSSSNHLAPSAVPDVATAAIPTPTTLVGAEPATTPATPSPTVAADTVTAIADTALTRTLKEGMSGDDVLRLQQRLKTLHFEPGEINGTYSHLTTEAVWAFQQLVEALPLKQADGAVTQDTWARIEAQVTIAPRKPGSTPVHVEAYIPQQVLVVFNNDAPVLVSHVSSGTGLDWKAAVTLDPGTPDNPGSVAVTAHIIGTAITPGGNYKFVWRYTSGDGWRNGKLGRMYKPSYFVGGVAVHGMTNVPVTPASHGCIRLPMGTTDANGQPLSPLNPADEFPSVVPLNAQILVFTADNQNATGSPGAPYDQPDPAFATTIPATTVPDTTVPAPALTVPDTTVPAPAMTVPAATVPVARPHPTTTGPARVTTIPSPPTTAPLAPGTAPQGSKAAAA